VPFYQYLLEIWTKVREITMPNKKKATADLPRSFATEEAAGEFWDSHSLAEHTEFLEPVGEEFELTTRIYEVQVSEEVFSSLRRKAEASHQSVPVTVDQILRKELSLAE